MIIDETRPKPTPQTLNTDADSLSYRATGSDLGALKLRAKVNPEFQVESINAGASSLLGIPPDTITASPDALLTATDPVDRPLLLSFFQESLSGISSVRIRFIKPGGEVAWIQLHGEPQESDEDSPPSRIDVVGLDVTADMLIRQQWQTSTRTSRIIRAANRIVFEAELESDVLSRISDVILTNGNFLLVNIGFAEEDADSTVRIGASSGPASDDFSKVNLVTWADRPGGQGPIGVAIRTCQPVLYRDLIQRPGFTPWREIAIKHGIVSELAIPLMDRGSAFGVLALYSSDPLAFDEQDVEVYGAVAANLAFAIKWLREQDAYVRSLEAQANLEARYTTHINASTDGVIILGAEGLVESCNPAAASMFGWAQDAMEGASFLSLVPERFREEYQTQFVEIATNLESTAAKLENIGLRTDGTEFPIESSIGGWEDTLGLHLIAIVRDISLRAANRLMLEQQVEELKKLNAENLTLMQELHHRVKNNFALVVSLLDLEARKVESEESRDVLRVAESRIHSMALVHELLYRSDDVSTIDFTEYLRKLVQHLSRGTGLAHIRVEHQTPPVLLDLREAIPCGLLVQELITNSVKYAFDDPQGGHITVSAVDSGDGRCTLTVKDDGVGMPDPAKLKKGLGLTIVESLVKQIHGSVTTDSSDGVTTTIVFSNNREATTASEKRD